MTAQPIPAGAVICSGVSLGYSSSCALIKSWEQGGAAKAVGIEYGKAKLSDAMANTAANRVAGATAATSKAENVIRSCQGQIRKFSQRLGQEGLRKAQISKARNIVQSSTAQMARQEQVISQAARTARVAGAIKVAVPVVFAATHRAQEQEHAKNPTFTAEQE